MKEVIYCLKKPDLKKNNRIRIKEKIFKEILTRHYWYYDYYHRENKEHFEVYNSKGEHLGEADMDGVLTWAKIIQHI